MDYTAITLNAAAKAMQDSVIPALASSGEYHALEQAHLVWDALRFARDRVDVIGERRRIEAIELAALIDRLLQTEAADTLAVTPRIGRMLVTTRSALADPMTTAQVHEELSSALGEMLTELLEECDDSTPSLRSEIERAVLDHALRKLELDRAWLLPLGFDPDPSSVKDLQDLLKGDIAV